MTDTRNNDIDLEEIDKRIKELECKRDAIVMPLALFAFDAVDFDEVMEALDERYTLETGKSPDPDDELYAMCEANMRFIYFLGAIEDE